MLSRNLFTSRGDDLGTGVVPNRNRVDGTGVARAQQSLPLHRVRLHEDRDAALVEHGSFGRFRNAVAEPNAEGPVDPDPQLADAALLEIAHIPSRPSSARAVSMMAGVISAMPRSLA